MFIWRFINVSLWDKLTDYQNKADEVTLKKKKERNLAVNQRKLAWQLVWIAPGFPAYLQEAIWETKTFGAKPCINNEL